ncbi:MAG: metallophosphoesterase [Candidatus Nanoarchaeia archaeon]|nr:metallophosphoesterase [Candidatus Nanoarchaeia archaeon]MDD5740423.1 metallophosphoesterase [Candidatus Nanoarchaeia archaeon]
MKNQINKQKKFKILAAGDFHGDSSASKRLAEKAEKENVDLVVLTGDITGLIETENLIKPFLQKNKRVVFVPGNWDTTEATETISRLYGIKNIGKHYVKYDNVGIFGVGNEDWQLKLNEGNAFKKLEKDFEKIKDLEKKIMVSHMHAARTKAEFSGFPGSKAIRKAIEKFQPDLFISGHIHEAEGLNEKIGKTRVISVGKKGKIIEI